MKRPIGIVLWFGVGCLVWYKLQPEKVDEAIRVVTDLSDDLTDRTVKVNKLVSVLKCLCFPLSASSPSIWYPASICPRFLFFLVCPVCLSVCLFKEVDKIIMWEGSRLF